MLLPVGLIQRIVPQRWRPRLRGLARRLPAHWWHLPNDRRLWWFTGIPEEMSNRRHLVRYDIQDGAFLEAYLSDRIEPDGSRECGPAVFLVVHGSEIMKFDCFGFPAGHYHVATPYPYGIAKGLQGRILLPERTAEEQVERAIFELQRNVHYYLQTHPRRKVRNTCIDDVRLAAACALARAKMREDARLRWEQGGLREAG